MGKLKSIFELAENLNLVLTQLDTELGLAQPQLVKFIRLLLQICIVISKIFRYIFSGLLF